MTNETEMNIYDAFIALSRKDKEDFDKKGINGRKPKDANFTEAAIKMADFCIENGLM